VAAAPLIPGDTQVFSSGSALAGVFQLSDLQSERMCATIHAWNFLSSNDPTFQQVAEANVVVPFSLNQAATVKVLFSGSGHFINANNGFQLFTGKDFSLREGLAGGGNTLAQFQGAGVTYLDLPAGDYRLASGTNESMFCSPFPCQLQSVGNLRLSVMIIDATSQTGDSANRPYVADSVTLNPELEQQFIDTNGAMVFRGSTETRQFEQKSNGWYAINARQVHHITASQSQGGAALISTLQLPNNLNGQAWVQVGEVNFGPLLPNNRLVMADFSSQLGDDLITGNNGIQGVAAVTVFTRPSLSQQWVNSCGFAHQQAIHLSFDHDVVDLTLLSSLVQDPLVTHGFE